MPNRTALVDNGGALVAPNSFVILSSAARTATTTSSDFTNTAYRGLRVTFNISTLANTAPSLVLDIQAKAQTANTYTTMLSSAAVVGTATNAYTIYPGIGAGAGANTNASHGFPQVFRVMVNANTATAAITYSIEGDWLL